MVSGSRVTDAVLYSARRGDLRSAVRVVRARPAERFRWRTAVGEINRETGTLCGLSRARIEEPVREVVLDIDDDVLRREVVLDARRAGVDLDRGEVLGSYTLEQLRELSVLQGVDLSRLTPYARLPRDPKAFVDTAAVVLVGRAIARHHRTRAQRLWLQLPDPDGLEGVNLRKHERFMLERADRENRDADRWRALTEVLLRESPTA